MGITMLPILTVLNITKEKDDYSDKKGIEDKIKKWYWSSIFTKNYSSSVESQMTRDFNEMKNWFKDDDKLPRVVERFRNELNHIDLSKEEIEMLKNEVAWALGMSKKNLGKPNLKSGAEMQQEACKGKTIKEMWERR